jgi:3-hydroxyisobutyrate dehydrogenase-like beta-hydroxyacid dehydrogenase
VAAQIGIVSPGEMGAAVGGALVARGHSVRWASEGRSSSTAERAVRDGLEDAGTVAALADASEIVISVCPPQAALEVARSLSEFRGVYVDANAIAPRTALAAAGSVREYVDGGIIGPPPREAGTTRLYLSGKLAPTVAELFDGTILDARVVPGELTAASALKMSYAGWTKGSAALLLAVHEAARRLGVDEDLEAEWALSQPELAKRLAAAASSRETKGWRWAPEMQEIARTLGDAGLPSGFHEAAGEVFRRNDH